MTAPKRRRVSASSIKALLQCSMAFYYERVLGLPTKQWPRTTIGSLCHSLFECLRHPRHRHHYDAIVTPTSVDYTRSPAVARLVRAWQVKHSIDDKLLADLNGMLYVGLVLIDFYWTGANLDKDGNPITHGPEHEFDLVLDDGTEIKGFIDDMAEVGDDMDVRDFKSQRNRFDGNELVNSIQAAIYQLYVWQRFGKLARVVFVLLRHPPTKRTPDKHLQITPAASPAHLQGLVQYIQWVAGKVNQFSMEDAWASPCQDAGWCRNVCSHYAPHDYWVVLRGDKVVKASLTPLEAGEGETVEVRRHLGCLHAWRGEH